MVTHDGTKTSTACLRNGNAQRIWVVEGEHCSDLETGHEDKFSESKLDIKPYKQN